MPDYLLPLAVIAIAYLVAPRRWLSGDHVRRPAVVVLIVLVWLVVGRYLWWRLTQTLPDPDAGLGEQTFAWVLLVIEMLIWIDTAILFLTLSRTRNNSSAADAGEARLRGLPNRDLPTVDVFIATYNEGLDVLEKTIIGATAIDWPKDRLQVCILDDGKRDWLRDYCAARGVTYFTREGNKDAKAGNINAAITRTSGDFFMVLDADFVPQPNFLYRAIGLFQDPKVGIVQIPHNFYNADPMQANLRMRRAMPDDQRLFFETIMVSRDGWDTAFCCGSNSITRRTAIEAVGGRLPGGSITEDMLLTLALLRKGFITRYLNERLALGLAPESLFAMYIQRARWARGAVQILFLREGPFGPGLRLHQRVMFIPLHWMTQPLMVGMTLLSPAICLWTGWTPLPNSSPWTITFFQLPALAATLGSLALLAPKGFFPVAALVHAALQAPRILPTVISTLIKPHGHVFKVTPKGLSAGAAVVDRIMIFAPAALIVITALGLLLNANINTRIVESNAQIPLLAFWSFVTMIVLSVVQAVAVAPRFPRQLDEERFRVEMGCSLDNGKRVETGQIRSISLTGARVLLADRTKPFAGCNEIRLRLERVGTIPARITRQGKGHADLEFELEDGPQRDTLIKALFAGAAQNPLSDTDGLRVTLALLARIFWVAGEKRQARAPLPAEAEKTA